MTVTVNEVVAGQAVSDHVAVTGAAVMSTGLIIFNVAGDVQILSLVSECYSANNATATLVAYSAVSPSGTTALSSNTTSLANVAAGYAFIMTNGAALGEAPAQGASGVLINTASRGVRIPGGTTIKLTVTTGPTTGTWKHYVRWEPLEAGAYITPAF